MIIISFIFFDKNFYNFIILNTERGDKMVCGIGINDMPYGWAKNVNGIF